MKSIEIENMTNTYSMVNELKCDVNDDTEKYMLYMQFVEWNCNDCPIFQELPTEKNYFTNSGKSPYLDLRASKVYTSELEKLQRDDSEITLKVNLKAALTKNMRLRFGLFAR